MASSFDALAKRLRALAEVPTEILQSVAPDIDRMARAAGKDGGPLRTGNAVVVNVNATESRIDIVRVASKDGVPYGPNLNVWERLIGDAVRKAFARRLGK